MAIEVKRVAGSKQFGIYVAGELIEGGFFEKAAANSCADDYRRAWDAEQAKITNSASQRVNR